MYEHVKTGCKHVPPSEQPLQFQSEYYLNKPRISWPILFKFIIKGLDKILLNICEFLENWGREGRAFLMAASKIVFTRLQ